MMIRDLSVIWQCIAVAKRNGLRTCLSDVDGAGWAFCLEGSDVPMVKWLISAFSYLLAVLTAGSASAQTASITDAAPAATLRATLSNGDCVSVDADGEPWSECGFQAWGMNAAGDRILTISTAGTVELWDGSGARLSSKNWQDEPGGASGYPNARVAIIGGLGVAVVHQNQVLVIDLASGAERARVSLDLMLIDTLMPTADGRLLGEGKARDWNLVAGEISLADARFTPIDGLDTLRRARPTYWVTRGQAPFLLTRIGRKPEEVELPRSCMPIDNRYCSWRDIPGDTLHILDIETLEWRAVDLGGTVDGYDIVEAAHAGDRWALVRCGRLDYNSDEQRACSVTDLATHTVIHRFRAESIKIVGVRRSDGTSALRIQNYGRQPANHAFELGFDGTVVDLGQALQVNLDAPRGGLIIPEANAQVGVWFDRDNRPLARLPFVGTACGFGWPNWMGNCAVSTDAHVWLRGETIRQGGDSAREIGERNETQLLTYDVPLIDCEEMPAQTKR
jgi:hypothetical protein